MDGGFDDIVRKYYGDAQIETCPPITVYPMEEHIKATILCQYNGFLPVGSAVVVDAPRTDLPPVCYTPTMEVPKKVPPRNAYNAFYGALTAISRYNSTRNLTPIKAPICTLFCSNTGGVDPRLSAYMMECAYRHFSNPVSRSWINIAKREVEIAQLEKSSLNVT